KEAAVRPVQLRLINGVAHGWLTGLGGRLGCAGGGGATLGCGGARRALRGLCVCAQAHPGDARGKAEGPADWLHTSSFESSGPMAGFMAYLQGPYLRAA